ncbi:MULTISPECIES: hypothetical protein [Acinetobacter calcoaceticus/baumannii complex]|uniref:hypothetical protein n=1 Tax=Acinetobacter calcoaceticus/baumannii complex TaxID=909768 RepID=UPI00148DD955|nr:MULTISPECIES: hypothetical protein [Acinetobacter calcoaceticus/baumannii complex]QWZ61957.1 hypothetical protein I6L28_08355 [Acinetobacter pittii]
MKKLFLVALLLGLSGCGDNNQSDTSQSDTQTTQLQTIELAVPTVTNYNLTASSLMVTPTISPLGNWSITNSTVMGASTLIDAVNDSRVSAALVTPNAKQVAEVLRGGTAGVALTIAVDQLLDAVDWVLDPANNQIRYKVINYDQQYRYSNSEVLEYTGIQYIYTIAEAENAFKKFFSVIKRDYIFGGCNINPNINNRIDCMWGYPNETPARVVPFSPSKNPDYGEKNLPLEAVAEQVITNADTGSSDAKVATNAATQNILNDAVQAESVVEELENNAENRCPSGITNSNGDCWVCSRESWLPIRSRVVYAKDVTNGLGGCSAGMNSSQLLTRYNAYNELGAARDAENACWSPQDQEHLIQARAAKATANDCKSYLGVLGQ